MAFDLVVRAATVIDGTGSTAPYTADVALEGERIVAVGRVDGRGRREINADGLLLTPGFVDIHTHFDGQATWDPMLEPSSRHGVTTVAMGNCGVGFAPARPDRHDWLIDLLEGVEDIPGTSLSEGMTWGWESFGEYLDALAARPRTIDVGAQVPHAALRAYAMGDRGADHTELPTGDEAELMGRLVAEALEAGAIGFATSRTRQHRMPGGQSIGTLAAAAPELLAIADAMARAGRGVIQLISDCYSSTDAGYVEAELALIGLLARRAGRPLSMSVQQTAGAPSRWRELFDRIATWRDAGLDVKAQVAPRTVGLVLGLEATRQPFLHCPGYVEVAHLPLAARVAALREPARRRRILDEFGRLEESEPLWRQIHDSVDLLYPLGPTVDYDLVPGVLLGARARLRGVTPAALAYDTLLEDAGQGLLYLPLLNFAGRTLDTVREMLTRPEALYGLSDAGAHCGSVCDASMPTSFLTLWARDRPEAERLPLPRVVGMLTRDPARHVGWHDRGVVAPGFLADLNLIELAELRCERPTIVHDLPAGGRRLVQGAHGYRYTVKAGLVTFEDGAHTGALPGRLVRGQKNTQLEDPA
jgi:N-acyl-D-amino-acid deacylase